MHAFAALADDTRREIVVLVAKQGELSASEISRTFSISAPAISQHLKVLKEAKVLHMKKDAQRRLYSLNPSGMDEMERWLVDVKSWNQRFDRLDGYLMKMKRKRADAKARR